MGDQYEVTLDGGGPWGIRLQGGKDFGVPLNVARVTPGSKASTKGILAGDSIVSINGIATSTLSHMDAQNTIKQSGSTLQLTMKKGKGVSLGEVKQVGSAGFAAAPSKTLYTTDVTHSAGVDHKFNAKPKAFGASPSGGQTASSKKFDPAEYAKRKKEELEKYKEEKNKPVVPDSDVLKMLQNTKIQDNGQQGGGSFNKLQDSLNNEDLPPPPPELMGSNAGSGAPNSYGFDDNGPKAQSGTFKRLQQLTDAGDGDQARTVFDQQKQDRGQPVYAGQSFTPAPKTGGYSGPTGPNFRVGRASAPSFKSSGSSYIAPKGPPPPAVNAGEVLNPNSKLYQQGSPAQQLPQQQTYNKPPQPASWQPSQQQPPSPGYNKPAPQSVASSWQPPQQQQSPSRTSSVSSQGSSAGGYQPQSPSKTSPGVFDPAANRSPKPFTPSGGASQPSAAPTYKLQSYAPPSGPAAPPQQAYTPAPAAPQQPYTPAPVAPQQPKSAPAQATNGQSDLSCSACDQPLDGPFVSAIGKTWHPDHFCCSSCQMSLQNQAFVEENNKLFCEKCYNSYYAPKCAHCNNAIIGALHSQRDKICDECSSVASASGIYDPISCSKSINWLLNQIREADTEYEKFTREKNVAAHRYREAKLQIAAMNRRRGHVEQEIEQYEFDYERTKRICEHRVKVCAANQNLRQKSHATVETVANLESKLYQAKNRLSSNTMKYNSVLSEYKERGRRLTDFQKRHLKAAGYNQSLTSDLNEMQARVETLQGRHVFRQHKMEAVAKEMEELADVIEDATTRTELAEQYHFSLEINRETLLEEINTIKTKRYDALDKIEEIKRLRTQIMRQYNISHPSQLLKR
ncbi:LIM domain-binding protein 3-like isoform X3 [Clytia hemisphaerica]|uniref:LIM domain-binding protein 3-like isoform X3 n=1 Tax=Clytia hemisphaerica TaxID=252671 RepID=UPI0034D60B32